MSPVILAVDQDADALWRVERELRARYEADYRVACESSAEHALERLRDLKAGEDVALVLAALQMEGIGGVEFLARVREVRPLAKRVLLITPPMDRETSRRVLLTEMALGRIDDFEFRPGAPPNEFFHQAVTDLLEEVGVDAQRLPVFVMHDGRALVDPTNREVADAFVGAVTQVAGVRRGSDRRGTRGLGRSGVRGLRGPRHGGRGE